MGVLGASWPRLGPSWARLGVSWARLVASCCVLVASWARLGASWSVKPPQKKLAWQLNGKRVFIHLRLHFSDICCVFQHRQTVRVLARVYSFTLRSLRSLRSLARCACTTVICFIRVRLLTVQLLCFSEFFFGFSTVLLRFFFVFSCFFLKFCLGFSLFFVWFSQFFLWISLVFFGFSFS